MLKGHKHSVHSITFDFEAKTVLTASVDAAIAWNLGSLTRSRTLGAGSGIVQALYSPCSPHIFVAFRDGSILAWDTATFALVASFRPPASDKKVSLSCIAVSADAEYLVAGSNQVQSMSGMCLLG